MAESKIRVVAVDDHEGWRKFASRMLRKMPESELVGEASDGLRAVELARELQPDLILLDIGLPKLNGIEVARNILVLCPRSRILFMTENRAVDIAEEALSTGASGYVIKSNAGTDLLPAIKAILEGKQFISCSLAGHARAPLSDKTSVGAHRHEVAFYTDDISVVDGYARFIESALNRGNAVIAVVTESHRPDVDARLQADGIDVATAIERGSYVPMDAADAMAALTFNDMPDPVRCAKLIGDLVTRAAKGARREDARVMVCGEIAPTMLSKGNAEGAIQLEHLWDEITRRYGVHTLCGYVCSGPVGENSPIFQRICAEHSAVCCE